MAISLIPAVPDEIKKIKKLYREAFPARERKPFSLFVRLRKAGKGEIFAVRRNGDFAGMIITADCGGAVLLDYFAILPEMRGGGVGSAALAALAMTYSGRRLFLMAEERDPSALNAEEREKRVAFYIRNGYAAPGAVIIEFGNRYELLTLGGDVGRDEYLALMRGTCGQLLYRIISPKII